ncbi:hypothetical protein RhiTH_009602 [Rhizoctonia solani]
MATCSRPASQTRSPINQGELGPQLPTAPYVKLGEVSLEQITSLLLGLISQVKNLKRKMEEVQEAGVKACTNLKNISQAVNTVKDGLKSLQLHGPWTPEDTKLL